MAFFGLFQAIFMANAGGAWDNAKKIVEVDMRAKGTPLHAATVVGDTVGDPFKDTSSVSMNPVIKFTTLFGLLAVEIAVEMKKASPGGYTNYVIGGVLFVILKVGHTAPTLRPGHHVERFQLAMQRRALHTDKRRRPRDIAAKSVDLRQQILALEGLARFAQRQLQIKALMSWGQHHSLWPRAHCQRIFCNTWQSPFG